MQVSMHTQHNTKKHHIPPRTIKSTKEENQKKGKFDNILTSP